MFAATLEDNPLFDFENTYGAGENSLNSFISLVSVEIAESIESFAKLLDNNPAAWTSDKASSSYTKATGVTLVACATPATVWISAFGCHATPRTEPAFLTP